MFCIALAGPPTNVIPVSMATYAKNSVGMETLLPCTVKAAKRYRKNVWFQPIERNDLRVVRFIGTADASSLLGVDWVCTGEVSERWWGRWHEWTEHLIALAKNGRHELVIGESESTSLVVLCSGCVRPTLSPSKFEGSPFLEPHEQSQMISPTHDTLHKVSSALTSLFAVQPTFIPPNWCSSFLTTIPSPFEHASLRLFCINCAYCVSSVYHCTGADRRISDVLNQRRHVCGGILAERLS